MSFYKKPTKLCPFGFFSFYINKKASQQGGCHQCVEEKCQLWMSDGESGGQCAIVNIADALMYSADNSATMSEIFQGLSGNLNQTNKIMNNNPPKDAKNDLLREMDSLQEDLGEKEQEQENSEKDYSLKNLFSKIRDGVENKENSPVPPPPPPPPPSTVNNVLGETL